MIPPRLPDACRTRAVTCAVTWGRRKRRQPLGCPRGGVRAAPAGAGGGRCPWWDGLPLPGRPPRLPAAAWPPRAPPLDHPSLPYKRRAPRTGGGGGMNARTSVDGCVWGGGGGKRAPPPRKPRPARRGTYIQTDRRRPPRVVLSVSCFVCFFVFLNASHGRRPKDKQNHKHTLGGSVPTARDGRRSGRGSSTAAVGGVGDGTFRPPSPPVSPDQTAKGWRAPPKGGRGGGDAPCVAGAPTVAAGTPPSPGPSPPPPSIHACTAAAPCHAAVEPPLASRSTSPAAVAVGGEGGDPQATPVWAWSAPAGRPSGVPPTSPPPRRLPSECTNDMHEGPTPSPVAPVP